MVPARVRSMSALNSIPHIILHMALHVLNTPGMGQDVHGSKLI